MRWMDSSLFGNCNTPAGKCRPTAAMDQAALLGISEGGPLTALFDEELIGIVAIHRPEVVPNDGRHPILVFVTCSRIFGPSIS